MNGPVEEQVRQLVREIRGHETERNRIARDGFVEWEVQASRLEPEIFRKFAIIDAIKYWDDEGGSEGAQARELKDLVSNAKKDTRAGAEDLKLMRIPRSGLRGLLRREELSYFPKYLEVPEVARKIILGKLTSPRDKLNVIKTMPFEGELMNWNETNLQFHLVFPIMMAQNCMESMDIVKLMAVNPSFEQSIKVYFENKLQEPTRDDSLFWDIPTNISELRRDEIRNLDTIPITVKYLFMVQDDSETRNINNNQLRSLSVIGTKIWNFSVVIGVRTSARNSFRNLDTMKLLRDCIHKMPNLRRLDVTIHDWTHLFAAGVHPRSEQDVHEEDNQIKAVALPDLPHLKVLNLHDPCENDFYLTIWKSFLQKYQSSITGTRISFPEMFPESGRLPRLKQIYLYRRVTRWEPLAESPLKCFRIEYFDSLRTPDEVAERLTNLMENLASRFGDTLEKLVLKIAYFPGSNLRTALNPSWITNWSFPNVKTLVLRIFPNYGDSTLLLRFSKLECLEVAAKSVQDLEGVSCQLLDFSRGVDSVKKSNVWKLLPFLRTISVYQTVEGPLLKIILTVNRSECCEVENNEPA